MPASLVEIIRSDQFESEEKLQAVIAAVEGGVMLTKVFKRKVVSTRPYRALVLQVI